MVNKLVLDNVEYVLDDQNQSVKSLVLNLDNTDKEIQEKTNLYAVFTRAKNSYVQELKREMIAGKSGVDIASLFD
jgi:hypothetical protein